MSKYTQTVIKLITRAMVTLAVLLSHVALAKTGVKSGVKLCGDADTQCTFVLGDIRGDATVVDNHIRAELPLPPFSSFKIASSLMAIDTNTIKDIHQSALKVNTSRYPVEKWWPKAWSNRSHNLVSAFQHSALPIYQQLVLDIGKPNVKKYIAQFDYGNRDISSGLDNFWLNGSIKISAIEQIDFLRRLYLNEVAVKPSSLDKMKTVMLTEETDHYRLYAKTGAGSLVKGKMLGWYVGFVENKSAKYKGKVQFFAFNLTRPTFSDIKRDRIKLARHYLKLNGVI